MRGGTEYCGWFVRTLYLYLVLSIGGVHLIMHQIRSFVFGPNSVLLNSRTCFSSFLGFLERKKKYSSGRVPMSPKYFH